ncbi:probable glycosyltransferase, type 2 [Halobacterium hubeiense]|jgi:glycosyltransferase involved in cell wall biosynthesis|uniref:Glycosyltransferase n=2 Tax=Halobacterium TaxID=2239 RepID=A0AAU8CFW1_9EURY|nr:glycosyltransferase [Halobacterium hubeiense]CQH48634.1 probable glycosyltransferase, type 2 [Halobacterium hubeiense]
MDLSVVVPTLNGRDVLAASLDALAAHAPDAEVIVVNGPSVDGTSGMVRDHDAVDLLLEVSERNLNASRNAGIAAADGDVVAFVGQDSQIREGWVAAVEAALDDGADAVTGPVHRRVEGGVTTESVETASVAGRHVTFFDGGNVAFVRDALDALDGFDEYLQTGAARDAAHRLAGMDREVVWGADAVVLREAKDDIRHRLPEDAEESAWGLKYRSLAYRLVKNYGFGARIAARIVKYAVGDAFSVGGDVLRGDAKLSEWAAAGSAVVPNVWTGSQDGMSARMADRTSRRNPNGVSARMDRTMVRHDC